MSDINMNLNYETYAIMYSKLYLVNFKPAKTLRKTRLTAKLQTLGREAFSFSDRTDRHLFSCFYQI